jgi:hypothetical protein
MILIPGGAFTRLGCLARTPINPTKKKNCAGAVAESRAVDFLLLLLLELGNGKWAWAARNKCVKHGPTQYSIVLLGKEKHKQKPRGEKREGK